MKTLSAAKINLTLEILGKRPDGFHELATWMLPIGLYDSLEIEKAKATSFTSNVPQLQGDSSNLIIRAARIFNQAFSIDAAYAIRLEKRIPVGAGLGGGSSNAAATLRLLNKLHNFTIERQQMEGLAAALGSDVPFFVHEQSAWCTGRGEHIQFRAFPNDLWICLFKPGFAISTAGAYGAYSQLAPDRQRGRIVDTEWGKLRNDLEPAVLPKYLFLRILKDWLTEQSQARFALMSGSGSTIFALVRSRDEGERLQDRFRTKFGEQTWSTVCELNPRRSEK